MGDKKIHKPVKRSHINNAEPKEITCAQQKPPQSQKTNGKLRNSTEAKGN